MTSGMSLIYSRKSVGPRMQPWGAPALTGYSCEDFPSRTTQGRLLLRKVKKTSMPNPVKGLGYMKCYSLSSPRPVKSPSKSIRHNNCQKICSQSRRPKTILEVRKKTRFLWVIINRIIYKFFKDFNNDRKKTNRTVVFSCRSFPNICKYRDYRWNLLTISKRRLLKTLIEEFS